ncbi:MAG: GntR family transcriptional regulator [Acidobacteria bacterium]|nr:GntR family transcriptional regulator [Acidobacteriota bacterium]
MLAHKIKVDPSNEKPLWQQVEEGLRRLITSGILSPGSLIISVRELAQELKINPTIVAKAYQRLIDSGVLIDNRWEGLFIAGRQLIFSSSEQKILLKEEALNYALTARKLGISKEEAISELRLAFQSLKPKQGKLKLLVKLTQLGK